MMKMVMLVIMLMKMTVTMATHHSSRLHSSSTGAGHPACLSLDLKSHLWIVDCGEGLMNKLMMAGISKIRC